MPPPPPAPPAFDRLDAAVRSAGVGVWLNPLPLGELAWNDNTKAHFHLPPQARPTIELFFERLHDDDRERVRASVARALEGRPFDEVYRTVGPAGEMKWIHAVGSAVFGEDGQPTQFDGITLDISTDISAQQALRAFADAAPAMLWVTEANGVCTFLSRAWTAFTGQPEAAGLGVGWLEMVHPDDRDLARAAFHEALVAQHAFTMEHRVRRPDGRWTWVIDSGEPRRGPDGEFLGFAGAVTDIHDRRLAEDALRQSSQRYSRLLETIDQGFCVIEILLDAQGAPADYRFIETNPVFEQQTGLDRPIGRTARELVPTLEGFWFQTYGTVALTQQPVRFTHGSEAMGRWFDVFASPIGVPADLHVAVLFQDISDRKRHQAALLEADRRKDEFLATLAHELRNPLAPIRSAAELLRQGGQDEAQQRRHAGVIGRQVTHLARMIDDLMDVSRMTRDKLELRVAPLVLQDVVHAAAENAHDLLKAGGHALALQLPEAPVIVVADEVRLVQVVLNLLTNAVRYSEPGTRIAVSLTPEAAPAQAVIAVQDQGIGIAADQQARVFDLFYQGSGAAGRLHGGLGIGLSLVQRLTHLHGGTVHVHSDGLGRGSRFTVRLPLAGADVPHPQAAAAPTERPAASARVLVVDDNRDAVDLLAEVLRMTGYEVVTAYDGVDGLAEAEASLPDVVVLDLGMPRLDGYGACRALRATDWGRQMKVLALSGWGQPADRDRTREAGFDQHLVKPVDPETLIQAIEQVLGADTAALVSLPAASVAKP
jgi:PAS domain S-box-containing protein